MEIETTINIEIDEDDWCVELDLDGRIESGLENILDGKVDEAVFEAMEDIRRQMGQATITPDRVREIVREIVQGIVREEIALSINGVGRALSKALVEPEDSIKAVIGEPIPANQAWNTNKETSND